MKQLLQILKRDDAEKRISVLRLEIDYELMTLHDAILENDKKIINETKGRLESLRKELFRLEV